MLQERSEASIEAHQGRVVRLETYKASLQEQLQQLQQAVGSKQQGFLQQLEQQQEQQQGVKAEHQRQLQALTVKHAEEVQHQRRQLQQEQEAAHAKTIQLESELMQVKAVLQQVAAIDELGTSLGWTCQRAKLMLQVLWPVSKQEADEAAGTIAATAQQQKLQGQQATDHDESVQQQQQKMSARNDARTCKPIELQLLLQNLTTQPGLLGVSRQQWWPMALVHAVGGADDKVVSTNSGFSTQAHASRAQLLAAVAAQRQVDFCSISNSSSSKSSQPATGDSFHHQLQLQLPWPCDATIDSWLAHGQIRVGLVNAHAAAVGVFQLPCISSRPTGISDRHALNSAESVVQKDGMALAVMLAVSQSCWVVRMYKATESGGPSADLGLLGRVGDAQCNWVDTDVPVLQPGEFLVPVSCQHIQTGALLAAGATAGCNTDMYSAACSSRLFNKTGRHFVLPAAQPHDQATGANGGSSGGVVCEVWQLQQATVRAAASKACACKEMDVAKEPWRGALDVLATAMMPVSTARGELSAEEAAAQARSQLLAPYSTALAAHDIDYVAHVLPGASAEAELRAGTVNLLHPNGKTVAQLQAVMRYARKL